MLLFHYYLFFILGYNLNALFQDKLDNLARTNIAIVLSFCINGGVNASKWLCQLLKRDQSKYKVRYVLIKTSWEPQRSWM